MAGDKVRFAIIGLDHIHVHNHVRLLREAGAEFVAYYSDKPELIADFGNRYAEIGAARSMAEILEDPSIDLIAGSPMPAERAAVSIAAMQHGKDVVTDKPAVTSIEQLDEIRRVQGETRRIWCLYSNEHHDRRCTVLAGELAAKGAIGQVVQTTGFGPHSISWSSRPAWFWDKKTSGGIIGDIEDYGEVSLSGDGGIGWFRADWFSPASLGVPGDIRLFVLGTEGYMEMRKYTDPGGREGAEHLLLVNKDGARFVETKDVALTFGARLLEDVRNRTETAIPQERSFLVTQLATEASQIARELDTEASFRARP
jgi:hypothetical protein